ncbi:DUF5134 domain-containing protein [Mycobacterium paraseoulense]|uniref:DUF5134 domain-containing protein n=1 Tax=Mycobacterium paraseoulense TaxID=590652 RepID=UPI00114F79AA|nr:DUF5134 domain-containing protein [Mycobacterium paraseoulense]MCV7396283.1 DUF5134 domain-containing protein [Mycobacterium paraseoulense]BBZ71077.1 DUF5134 domain-containing protein [Mycobacterium paraseoulense]
MDNTVRWLVTALFAVSFASYAYFLVAQRRCWTGVVSQLLHLAMSAVMISMAWGVGMSLPTIVAATCFLLGGAWFVGIAGRAPWAADGRLTNYYYALMMVAMAWMYGAMNGSWPGHPEHTGMDGMNMPAPSAASGVQHAAHRLPQAAANWVSIVNWAAALGFGAVAILWAYRWLAQHWTRLMPRTVRLTYAQIVTQAVTAAGTALMFADIV